MHVRVVIAAADPVAADAAQGEFPGVDVRVDEAGDHDVAAAVDNGGIVRADIAADFDDLLAVDQDVAAVEVADFRVH